MVIEAKNADVMNENYNIAGSQTELEPVEANAGEVVELEEDEELYEMELTDDAILYYIEDEEGNEIGFAIEEDGQEVEYFYATECDDPDCACHEEELLDMEVDEDAIVAYLYDENDQEIGFVIEEDGQEVEYFYAEEEVAAPAPTGKKSYPQGVIGDIRRKSDDFLAKAEEKIDNGDMGEETKKIMGGVADAADTMREIKDTMREFKDAFSFRL